MKLASPYLDNELTAEEKARFEVHRKGCPECSARLEAFQGIHAVLAKTERDKAPAWFAAKVMARAARPKPRPFARTVLVRFAETMVVALMIMVGVLSGGMLVNGGQGQRAMDVATAFSLDVFEPAPPDSMGGVYLAMTEASNEK
jgi:anti-sigma factor RsiW